MLNGTVNELANLARDQNGFQLKATLRNILPEYKTMTND
jgi:hypothetical protein